VKDLYTGIQKSGSFSDPVKISQLPVEFNGVPVFRIGMKEGAAWLTNKDTGLINVVDTFRVRVYSKYYLEPLRSDFPIGFRISRKELFELDFFYTTDIYFRESRP
jgi:hypothetical protein